MKREKFTTTLLSLLIFIPGLTGCSNKKSDAFHLLLGAWMIQNGVSSGGQNEGNIQPRSCNLWSAPPDSDPYTDISPTATTIDNQLVSNLYTSAHADRLAGNYQAGFDKITQALSEVYKLQNKFDYWYIYWEEIILNFLKNGASHSDQFNHKTLYILVQNASIEALYDEVNHVTYPISPAANFTITSNEISLFRSRADEFDLFVTALTRGRVQYTHDILIVDNIQKDLALRAITPWDGTNVYLYTSFLETFEPDLSTLLLENYHLYDTISIILPDTLHSAGAVGIGTSSGATDLMEGGVAPTGLPVVRYLYNGDKRGLLINNIDTASEFQLFHEYFHMLEGTLKTQHPQHVWKPGIPGKPAWITNEIEYYRYMFDYEINDKITQMLYLSRYGNDRFQNTALIDANRNFASQNSQSNLKEAFLLTQRGDINSLQQALNLVQGYSAASVKMGQLLRATDTARHSYQSLKANQDLDPFNSNRLKELAWLLDYNFNLSRLALSYYTEAMDYYDEYGNDTLYFMELGRAKGSLQRRETANALTILNDPCNEPLQRLNNDTKKEWNLYRARAYLLADNLNQGEAALAIAESTPSARADLNSDTSKIRLIYNERLKNWKSDLPAYLETLPSPAIQADINLQYQTLLENGKIETDIDLQITYFYQASLLYPENWEPWFWMGYYLYGNNRFSDSLYAFEKVRSLSSDPNAQDYYNLYAGMIYIATMREPVGWPLVELWIQSQVDSGNTPVAWATNVSLDYHDIILNNTSKAMSIANTLSTNNDAWYANRAYLWIQENQ